MSDIKFKWAEDKEQADIFALDSVQHYMLHTIIGSALSPILGEKKALVAGQAIGIAIELWEATGGYRGFCDSAGIISTKDLLVNLAGGLTGVTLSKLHKHWTEKRIKKLIQKHEENRDQMVSAFNIWCCMFQDKIKEFWKPEYRALRTLLVQNANKTLDEAEKIIRKKLPDQLWVFRWARALYQDDIASGKLTVNKK